MLLLFYIAPTAPPNISLTVIDAQSIRVTICPPPARDQNGVLTFYNGRYRGDPFDASSQDFNMALSLLYPAITCTDIMLMNLQEYNNYTVSVQAQNSETTASNFSEGVTVLTNQAGNKHMSLPEFLRTIDLSV